MIATIKTTKTSLPDRLADIGTQLWIWLEGQGYSPEYDAVELIQSIGKSYTYELTRSVNAPRGDEHSPFKDVGVGAHTI